MQQKTMPTVEEWKASDGTMLGVKRWTPEGESRAVVVALHGLNCTTADWEPLAGALNAERIALEAWNLRGQGLDPQVERRGAWLEVDGMLDDLEAFATGVRAPGRPLFIAGDSMGALLAARAVVERRIDAAGLLLFVPVVELAQKNPPWIKALMRWASRVFPSQRLNPSWFVHGRPTTPKLSRIARRQEEFENASHRIRRFTLGFLVSMGDLIESAVPAARKVELPVAVFSAGRDVFVSQEATETFLRALGSSDKTHFHYPEAYHQLLHDLDAERVADDAAAWIAERLSARRDEEVE